MRQLVCIGFQHSFQRFIAILKVYISCQPHKIEQTGNKQHFIIRYLFIASVFIRRTSIRQFQSIEQMFELIKCKYTKFESAAKKKDRQNPRRHRPGLRKYPPEYPTGSPADKTGNEYFPGGTRYGPAYIRCPSPAPPQIPGIFVRLRPPLLKSPDFYP